ncbi:MAG: aminotransferase class III-fold pyridoxal phosphate-dependent enzyme, partial [Chlamydiota bacterium]
MDLIKADSKCIWHPFTQTKTAAAPIPIVRALGSKLFHADGHSFIDAISSWWCNIHGHGHPHIVEAISRQAATLDHVLFGGVTHPEAVRLAQRLLELLP